MEKAGKDKKIDKIATILPEPKIQAITDNDLEAIKIVDDIRITPSCIHFANAYEGKIFNQKVIIQNIGKNASFVRMLPPSSNMFEVKFFKQGRQLSPGLKITRTITYRYMASIAVLQARLPVWINEKLIEIKMFVTLSTAVISVDPQIVDFGRIDADHAANVRTLTIHNTGYKGAQFAIDLGSNQLQLVVEPMKGMIYAHTSINLNIELVGTSSGEFLQEFWIKTSPPKRVIVKGTFIEPKLLTRSFFDSLHFSIVEFPRTYYGAKTVKPLFIQNQSSSNSTFYVMAEIRGKIMTLEDARRLDDNYKQFTLQPYDGRMYADKGSLVLITFSPKRMKNKKYEKHHFACFLRIIRMNWKDVTPGIFKEEIEFPSDTKDLTINESLIQSESNTEETYVYQSSQELITPTREIDRLDMESSLKVAIYGNTEIPEINLIPDLIILKNLEIGGIYLRELSIENRSKYNAIIIKYCKIVNIDIVPNKFKLDPREKIEIAVKIHPVQIGTFSKHLVLDLLCPDIPDSSGELRKIGQVFMKIEYEAKMSRKIARKPCCTNKDLVEYLQEPLKDYRLTVEEEELKHANKAYYSNYFREMFDKPPSKSSDYDLTDKRLLLMENYSCKSIPVVKLDNKKLVNYFIPLSPKQLYFIRIFPRVINLNNLTPFSTITEMFTVENQNNFPICIYLKPSKSCINFQNNSRFIMAKNRLKKIYFNFSTNTVGKYNVSIHIVINESHIFQIAVVANIVLKDIRLVDKRIKFMENDVNYKLVKISNDFNSTVNFEWDLQESCFSVYPKCGTIGAETFQNCAIYYTPNPDFPETAECFVFSETKPKQTVHLSYEKIQPKVVLIENNVNCGVIPINTTIWKFVTLINQKNQIVYYRIEDAKPIDGIEVQPSNGVMKYRDELKLKIKLHFKSPMDFVTKLIIHLQESEVLIVKISGSVDCPEILLKPDYIQFSNVSPQSCKTYSFKIQNLSLCRNRIRFKLDDYPEITITETEENSQLSVNEIRLESNEIKMLYCHFRPDKICNYLLYLPVIINDLIGPPLINDKETIKFQYNFNNREIVKMLPLLKICCSMVEQILQISSLQPNFIYFNENHRNNRMEELIKFTNISDDIVRISLQLDDLDCFEIIPINLENFVFRLKKQQFGIFQIKFKPKQIGNCRCKLPIFLNNRFFNYIELNGIFQLPQLIPERNVVYFEPVFLNLKIQQELLLKIDDNHQNCEISTKIDNPNITFTYEDRPLIANDNNNKTIIFTIISTKPQCIDEDLQIFCSCGGRCTVRIKAIITNSLITTHHCYQQIQLLDPDKTSDFIYKNCENYPKFPTDNDESFYGNHQRQVLENIENWLFIYCFDKKKHHHIPESFTEFTLITDNNSDKKKFNAKKIEPNLPIVELILNFIGKQQRRFLVKNRLKSVEDIDQLSYIFAVYTDILDYLKESGGLLPHIEAKLLLNYQQYLLFNQLKENNQNCYDSQEFYLLSKQSWLDLILEIIRIFVYDRRIGEDSQQSLSNNNNNNVYSWKTLKILDWLKGRCLEENPELHDHCDNFKQIDDLRDCLILSFVTLSYCPYIKNDLNNLILNPINDEEIFHNCCILIELWQLLKFNINLDPLRLFKPQLIEMLLLLNYLYETLPNYAPLETLMIEAPLSQYGTIDLNVNNPYRFRVNYDISLIDNNRELFVIKDKFIKIPASKSSKLTIKYFAKFMESTSSILILSNDNCKSLVYNLVGNPNLSHYTTKIELNLELYEIKQLDLLLQSPYRMNCNYRSMFCYTPGEKLVHFTTNPSIKFEQDSTDFDDNGQCLSKTKICCLELDNRPLWVYYQNPNVGDWCVKFVINIASSTTKFRKIHMILPKNFDNFQCSCQYGPDLSHLNCPKIIKIPIPSRNYYLWEMRKELILENISAEDYEIWKYRLGTPSGARIIELLVQSSLKSLDISQHYQIKFNRKPPFILKDSLEIHDVFSEDSVNLVVHAVKRLSGVQLPMSLLSVDGKELRYYQINFVVSTI